MASANLVAYNAALKQTWTEDRLQEQIYQGDEALTMVETTRRFKVGKEAVTPLHTARSAGYTVLGAGGGTLNAASNQASKQAKWNYTNHHFNIAVEGETIDGTADDAIAVAQVIDTEVNFGLNDMRRQLVRQIFSAGDSHICTMGVTTASTTVVLDPVSGWNAIERGWLFVGATIDIGTDASPTLRSAPVGTTCFVTGIVESETAPTITVAATAGGASVAITTAATDFISWKGSRGAGTTLEMNGLGNIVSLTATLGQLTVAGEPTWKAANVESNAGVVRPFTLPLLYKQNRKIKQKTGDGADTVATSYKQEEAFYVQVQAMERFTGDVGDVGKTESPTYRGMRVKGYLDCKNEDMWFFQKAHMFICAADKPYWQNKLTGGEILTWIQQTDSYGAKCTYRIQFCNRRRNGTALLTDLA